MILITLATDDYVCGRTASKPVQDWLVPYGTVVKERMTIQDVG